MGRQFTFYMGGENKHSFFEFLKQESFLFITSSDFGAAYDILDDPENEIVIYMYKKEYGEVNYVQIPNTDSFYIDRDTSPLIVLKVPHVDDEKLRVLSGRLWLTSEKFADENANRKAIEKDYRKLVRWLKKNIPFQDCEFHGAYAFAVDKAYADDEVVYKLADHKYDRVS